MKTLDEACEIAGITKRREGLNLHFNPIPNWYGCIIGFECPVCGDSIEWKWGKLPNFTNEESTANLRPEVKGARLLDHGHRWINLECEKCKTNLFAENFD